MSCPVVPLDWRVVANVCYLSRDIIAKIPLLGGSRDLDLNFWLGTISQRRVLLRLNTTSAASSVFREPALYEVISVLDIKMAVTCEVCSSEQAKYRCPTCGLMSCSLGCTQSHKIYCTPKPQEQNPSNNDNPHQPETDANNPATSKRQNDDRPDPAAVLKSPDLEPLLNRYPQLRAQLRDMYKTTLEEEWVELQYKPQAGRGRANSRGGRGGYRNRGPWTREKGFNRGLGKVRKYREQCEAGLEIGKDAEGFMRFVALVNGSGNGDDPLSQEPA